MAANSQPPEEVWTSERCYITELLNDPSVPDVSLARARVEPGHTTQLHTLDVLEWYIIEQGTGLMTVGDREPFPVKSGDSVEIPTLCEQMITNTGNSDLLFLCVCVPRFELQHYTSCE